MSEVHPAGESRREPTWLGDPARFPAVIARLGETRWGWPPTVDEQLAAEWVGYMHGPRRLLKTAELHVICADCREIILGVNYIDSLHPLVIARTRGDRLDASKALKRGWDFSWMERSGIAYARCNHPYSFSLAALQAIALAPGKRFRRRLVWHATTGGIVL